MHLLLRVFELSLKLEQTNQWRNYRGSSYSRAVGPGHVGGPGPTKNKNFVSEKCELNNNILLKPQFFFNALN